MADGPCFLFRGPAPSDEVLENLRLAHVDDVGRPGDSRPEDLVSVLVDTGIAKSRNEARRLIEQGGVKVNGEKVGLDAPAPKAGDVVGARRRYIELK